MQNHTICSDLLYKLLIKLKSVRVLAGRNSFVTPIYYDRFRSFNTQWVSSSVGYNDVSFYYKECA